MSSLLADAPAAQRPAATRRGSMQPLPRLSGPSHVRLFQDGGLLASADTVWRTKRFAATLLMAVSDQDLELEIDGHCERFAMVAVRPFVTNQLNARHTPFVCLDLSPDHPDYHAFTRIAGRGCVGLPRARCAGLADALREFHAGGMRGDEAQRLFRRAVNLALTVLPHTPPLDPRIRQVKATLLRDPTLSAEALASACGLSPSRLSHMFAHEQGFTLRQYTQWLKIKVALSLINADLSLTEIAAAAGFADSAHFCKVWSQIYGAPPAYFFCNDEVTVFPKLKPRA